ncbi:alpha/beta hydrolase [Bradyrhizobium sp. C-145]|uniref:alpha/beta hydrolase n=1 Tax=Bradyrhizobium sp. C-145 TaxID=574727 RepID=UPI00201B93A8|nr:alpha/beta hydrolase [Bradyrhizobium sp. C-145]UQR62912.1 alpha/beta hydrolase [Bradyrhizobium sp. C-145]
MTLDPQVEAHLKRLAGTGFADLHKLPPDQVRAGMRRMSNALGKPESVAQVEDRAIQTVTGDCRIRVYRPAPSQVRPIIVFFHGGGFVLGDLDTHDGLARALANATGSVVVSVNYPLAPENKYPAARNAAYAATKWIADHAAEIGGDASRLAVAGDSAGGNLAAVVALMARDAGAPKIAFQLLIYPDLDFRRSNTSIREFAGKWGNISRETQDWFMNHYLNKDEEKLDPLVSPLLAPSLAGLPRTFIITAEYDALRDEGEDYGRRLQGAGVDVVVRRYDGMIHEFLRWPFDGSRQALRDAADTLATALGS